MIPLCRRSLIVLPIILCLALILCWNCCHAKSSRMAARNLFDRIEPPEGLEWMENVGEKIIRRKRPIHQQRRQLEEQQDAVELQVNFGPLRGEGLRRFEHSYSLFELENDANEWNDGKLELGEPIPWFSEWERMVANEKKEGQMRKLNPAKKNVAHHSPNHRRHSSVSSLPSSANSRHFRNIQEEKPCLLQRKKSIQHRTYPRSYEFPGFEVSIPREWDWRNVSGMNFCSPNRNQHIPVYCGGCWVFGTLGMLNDRFNIARKNRWPMTFLSPQEIIACNGRGSCNGGTAEDVFEHSKTVGLVEEGCNNYKAVNEKCTPFTRCGSCWPGNCFAVQNYTRYYIKDFGTVSGRLQMMSEIHNRGPIACTVGCTGNFDMNYTRGIYEEMGDFPMNHIVSVSGWGWDEETKTEYWIVRNSWGDAWGEDGWFRIVTSIYKGGRGDQYNLGIERQCYFADPDVSNLNN